MCAHHVKEPHTYFDNEREMNYTNAFNTETKCNAEQANAEAEYVNLNNNNEKEDVLFLSTENELRGGPDEQWNKRIKHIRQTTSLVFLITLCVLVVLFLAFITFGILYSGIKYHGKDWHNSKTDDIECSVTFGAILGVSNGVFAYSNCNDSHASDEWNTVGAGGEKSGLKWQCVEYARRYLLLRGAPEPATFADVDGAADIWQLTSVRLLSGSTARLVKCPNGATPSAGGSKPRSGDLLIYPRQPGDFPFGHVAVIVGVTHNSVLVAEQNWENKAWPGPHHNYSREISMAHDAVAQTYTITDTDNISITGWVRYTA